jgi:RimJ/RimL family protein N-acetyltransferase
MRERISHALRKARTEGVTAVFSRLLALVRGFFFLREQHVWYQLDLAGDRPRRDLIDGVRLLRAGDDELHYVEEFGRYVEEARERRAAGNDLWVALEGGQPLFACWTFRTDTPVYAAEGGWLQLPERTACLEDSVTSPLARGKGIAPASWCSIADALGQENFDVLITKVATDNAPSRKAVEKAGFREIAVMDMTRIGPSRRVAVACMGGVAESLARSLGAA